MPTLLILAGIALAISIPINLYQSHQKMKRWITSSWGQAPKKRSVDPLDSVRSLWDYHKGSRDIDETTWNDLDMDALFQRINASFSSLGSEYLYALLHRTDQEDFSRWEKLIQAIQADEPFRFKVAEIFYFIGKSDHHALYHLMQGDSSAIKHPVYLKALRFGLFLWPLVALFKPSIALMGATLHVAIHIVIHYRHEVTLKTLFETMSYLQRCLQGGKLLLKQQHPALDDYQQKIRSLLKDFTPLLRYSRSLSRHGSSEADAMLTLLDVLSLKTVNHYYAVMAIFHDRVAQLLELTLELGEIDASWSIASWREQTDVCLPQFSEEEILIGEDLAHPLLKDPVPNPLHITRNTLISGSNASGKSTYVKSIALACIMAQNIHCVSAKHFQMPRARILSSMAIQDNVLAGESYFIAEIRSLKRILQSIDDQCLTIAFIDEILRGTNTVERIASSHALLSWMHEKHLLCMVATHDRELLKLQENSCESLHFKEQIDDQGIHFDHKLYSGPATTRNAIRLLEFMDYPLEIVQQADQAAEHFEKTGRWIDR